MATIKSYTDIEQSKKLAEILPIETADMFLAINGTIPMVSKYIDDGFITADNTAVPCWSLSALLGVLPFIDFTAPQLIGTSKTLYVCKYNDDLSSHAHDNAVDACVELILKLHELNLL